jgi:hypothetical protein
LSKIHPSVAIITAYDIKSQQVEQVTLSASLAVKYQSAHRSPRAIQFNPHHLVLWSFLCLSQWVYVRDDMSKGLKIMSLGVINHGMSLSVLYRLNEHDTLFKFRFMENSVLFGVQFSQVSQYKYLRTKLAL